MVWVYVLFILGIIIIVKGGDIFVDSAGWIARVSGIPQFIIGATIVSVATTLPELITSAIAAKSGMADMAIGNAVGSVTANTGLIMAIGLVFMPSEIKRKTFVPKAALLILVIASLWLLSRGDLSYTEGIILFIIFFVFIFENIYAGKSDSEKGEKVSYTSGEFVKNIFLFALGGAAIYFGSDLLVDNGQKIAQNLGISERIISITIIAVGTSLPELVTTITAITKKQSSLSVGNIIGANIIDTALILPVCSLISGGTLPVSEATLSVDIPVCLLCALIAVIPPVIGKRFYRAQGVILILVYILYLVYSCMM